MDFAKVKLWIYLIVGAIYLISRFAKKKEVGPRRTSDFDAPSTPSKPVTSAPQKSMTFEELLREIESKKASPSPQPTFVDYDDDLKDEEEDLEVIPGPVMGTKIFEEGKKVAFTRPSLEETVKLADIPVKFGKFGVFEEEKQPNALDEYLRDLRDPEGFKKAFVMSEILNRKY